MNDIFTEGIPQTVQDMARLREKRRKEQHRLFRHTMQCRNFPPVLESNAPERAIHRSQANTVASQILVMFSLVIPGPIKNNKVLEAVFNTGCRSFLKTLEAQESEQVRNNRFGTYTSSHAAKLPLTAVYYTGDPAGSTAYWMLTASALYVKKLCCTLERTHPLGILWDFDVFSAFEQKLAASDQGFPARPCLICGKPAKYCARNRTHSVPELQAKISEIVGQFEKNRRTF